MGVTLERVQNKFACIIGELSNNPTILSQFAIWVDLRIAEYKSKGAISLECSGDDPDPSWLQGHKSSPRRSRQREQTHEDYCYDKVDDSDTDKWRVDSGSIPVETLDERLSPDVVQVKEEFNEFKEDGPVFPVRIQVHEKRFGSWGRKRKADHNSDNHKDKRSYDSDQTGFSQKKRQQSTDLLKTESFQSLVKDTIHNPEQLSPVINNDEESFTVKEENFEDSALIEAPSTSNLSALTSACWSRNSGTGGMSQEIVSPVVNRVLNKTSASTLLVQTRKPVRNWTEDDMKKAVAAVQSGFLSQRAASRLYNVPQTSIHRRVSGKVIPNSRRPYTHSAQVAYNMIQEDQSSRSCTFNSGEREPDNQYLWQSQSLTSPSGDIPSSGNQENQLSYQMQPVSVISSDELQYFGSHGDQPCPTQSFSHDSIDPESPRDNSSEADLILSSTTLGAVETGLLIPKTFSPSNSSLRNISDLNINLNTIAKVRETLSLPAERPSVNVAKQSTESSDENVLPQDPC